MAVPHPLAQLSPDELVKARDIIAKLHSSAESLFFRAAYLQEPKKSDLVPFLELEHSGQLTDGAKRPPRQARVEYDVIGAQHHEHYRAVVDLGTGQLVSKDVAEQKAYPYYTPYDIL